MTRKIIVGVLVLALAGCANTPTNMALETTGYDVAVAFVAAKLANPKTTPTEAAQLKGLLVAAQTALTAWQQSQSPNDLTALNAAVAAIVAYETSAGA
jgi:hypothetical protein